VYLGYNNSYSGNLYRVTCSSNTWHVATVTYDSITGIGKCYLDGVLADSGKFQIIHGNDKDISITYFASGTVFKGVLADLKIYSKVVPATGIDEDKMTAPTQYALFQNYPNPFNPSTTIEFSLPQSGFVTLKVFNVLGEEVAILVNEWKEAGNCKVIFDSRHWPFAILSSGAYFYRMQTGAFVQTKRLMLLR
jgi:hypothetical protein